MTARENQSCRIPALALSAVISTTILMMLGSVVRVTGNGVGCPDWPLCYGQAIPPIFHQGAWIEFSHRVAALIAGAQIALVFYFSWRHHRNDKWFLRPALAANILLLLQVILGGVHVVLDVPPITGWIHTANAMLIVGLITIVLAASLIRCDWQLSVMTILGNKTFTLTVSAITLSILLVLLSGSYAVGGDVSLTCRSTATCAATMSSVRNWAAVLSVICIAAALANTLLAVPAMRYGAADLLREKLFVKLVLWTTAISYLLLLTGSYVTRSGASLACPGVPLCGQAPAIMRKLIDIQLMHRYTAYVVSVLVLVIVFLISTRSTDQNAKRFVYSLMILLCLQINLGAANILLKLPMWSRTLHLLAGTYLWMTLVALWVSVILGAKCRKPATHTI